MPETVDVWVVSLDRPEEEVRRLYATLSPGERVRAGDPPFGERKRRYVTRQAAVRAILALVALARHDVGIDVERIRDRPAARRAAELGIESFFERWTRTEASGKALGTGLLGSGGGEALSCTSLDVGPGFAAAVAVVAEQIEVRLRPY